MNKKNKNIQEGKANGIRFIDVLDEEEMEVNAVKGLKRSGEKLLGDFDGDGKINILDFNTFKSNYNGIRKTCGNRKICN